MNPCLNPTTKSFLESSVSENKTSTNVLKHLLQKYWKHTLNWLNDFVEVCYLQGLECLKIGCHCFSSKCEEYKMVGKEEIKKSHEPARKNTVVLQAFSLGTSHPWLSLKDLCPSLWLLSLVVFERSLSFTLIPIIGCVWDCRPSLWFPS